MSLFVYSLVIFSHRYLDSDGINFKTFVFLAVYWSIKTSSCNTDIEVEFFFKMEASTMLNNVFNANGHNKKKSKWSFIFGISSCCSASLSCVLHVLALVWSPFHKTDQLPWQPLGVVALCRIVGVGCLSCLLDRLFWFSTKWRLCRVFAQIRALHNIGLRAFSIKIRTLKVNFFWGKIWKSNC